MQKRMGEVVRALELSGGLRLAPGLWATEMERTRAVQRAHSELVCYVAQLVGCDQGSGFGLQEVHGPLLTPLLTIPSVALLSFVYRSDPQRPGRRVSSIASRYADLTVSRQNPCFSMMPVLARILATLGPGSTKFGPTSNAWTDFDQFGPKLTPDSAPDLGRCRPMFGRRRPNLTTSGGGSRMILGR